MVTVKWFYRRPLNDENEHNPMLRGGLSALIQSPTIEGTPLSINYLFAKTGFWFVFRGSHKDVVSQLLVWQRKFPDLAGGISNTLNILYRTHPEVKLTLSPLSRYPQFRYYNEMNLIERACATKHRMKYLYANFSVMGIHKKVKEDPDCIKRYEKLFGHQPIPEFHLGHLARVLRNNKVTMCNGIVTPLDHYLRCAGVDIKNAISWEGKELCLSTDPYFSSTYRMEYQYKHRLRNKTFIVVGSSTKLISLIEWVPTGSEIITIGIPHDECYTGLRKVKSHITTLNELPPYKGFVGYQHYVKN